MTVPATARRAGPYNGNGSTTSFSFSFKTFANGDLQVTKTSTAGIESVLVLNSDYTVSLNPDQDTSPGGTITYPITGSALATGEKLTIVGDLEYEQTTDLLGGGAFNARVIEDTFDRATIQIQQLEERLDRALSLPVSVTASAVLPTPEASKVIGWNVTEDGLVNLDASSLASVVASAYVVVDKFTGDGTTTQFICSQLPGSTNAAEVTIAGVMQNPAVDYTVSGARVVFTSAPPNGAVIIVRFLVAASQSSGSAFTTERHVATAGQTVFNLANAYAPGADTLTVFVNGLLMSSTLDYAETSANVVTFTSGLTLNDEVVFHIWRTNTLTTADAANVSFLQAGTGAVTRTAQSKLRDIKDARDFGAVADGVTNNTAAVQSAINSLGVYGGTVYIPDGAKFNLRSLTFPARFNLEYRVDDDTSNPPGPATTLASSERVLFSSNSSYPLDPTGGVVNEWRMTAPFHPGMVVDVRKDLGANIAPYLGPGQTVSNPVRASWNILDEQVETFRVIYENYQTFDTFSGVFMHGWRRVVRLNGVGTAQWTSVPAANVTITGATSGAKGFVLAVAAGYTEVIWFSGEFVVGERLTDNNETTTATVTSVLYTYAANSWMAQDLKTGAWTLGDRPPGVGTETFNVGGNVKVVPTRGGAINIPKAVTNPGYAWGDDPEAGSPNQVGIIYPTSGTASLRRLQMVRQDLTTSTGPIVPVSVMCNIRWDLLVDTNSANVSSVTNPATGEYLITFSGNLARAAAVYALSLDGFYMADWWGGVTFQAVGSVTVRFRNASGVAANLPTGAIVGLIGMGGDI